MLVIGGMGVIWDYGWLYRDKDEYVLIRDTDSTDLCE